MPRISQKVWDKYKNIVTGFHDEAAQDEIIWERYQEVIPFHGEDRPNTPNIMILKGMYQYNGFRVWPLTMYTQSGEEDKQSEVIIFSMEYLRSLNLLDSNGKLMYNQAKDKFVHKGIRYESGGDTFLAQAKDEPLLFLLILKRLNGYSKSI
jgi:hypothetical protein